MNVVDADMYYLAAYRGSKTLDALTKLENLELNKKRYQPPVLRKKIKKLLK